MVEFEDAVSERMAQLEQEDLERYQRDLDSQRRIVRMRRPIQRFEMSVQDYYRRFCYWREDMMRVGCPDNESSYIDDFIGNLQWQVQLRASNRRSRMSKLVDAFYEARFEETTLLLERMVKDLKEANEINEMNDEFPTEAANALNEMDDSVGEVSIASNQQTESYAEKLKANIAEPFAHKLFDDMPRSFSIELKEEDGDSDGVEACDEQHLDDEIQSNESAIKSAEDGKYFTDKLLQISFVSCEETELNEGNDCVVLGKMDDQNNACVFAKMPEPIPTENLLNIEVAKANQYLLDERPMVSHVDSLEDSSDLSYKDDVLGASDTNSLSLPNLGFTLQIFDPGTLAHSKKEDYESPLNASDSQLYGILLTERVMSCENTVNSSINEVNKQNGENDDYRNDAQDMFDETNPAFRTNVIDVDRVLEGMPHPNSIGIQGAKDVLDENVNVALDALGRVDDRILLVLLVESIVQGDKSQVDVLEDSALNVCDEVVLNPTYLKLTEEFHDIETAITEKVEKALKVECLRVSGNLFYDLLSTVFIFDPGISSQFDEMFQSFQEAQLKEQVVDLYAYNVKYITLVFFDPGGGRNGAVSLSIKDTHPLIGKSHEMYVFGFKGVTSSQRHTNLYINTTHRNSLQALFHDMDKCTAAVVILRASKYLEGAIIHMFVIIHPKDDVPAGLPIQMIPFEVAGRILHTVSTLLSSDSSGYPNAVVQRVIHCSSHLLDGFKPSQSGAKRCNNAEHLNDNLLNEIGVPVVTLVDHFSEMFGSNVMNIGLDMSRPKHFWLGLLLSGSKHFAQYMLANDNDNVAITTLEDFIWDPGWSVTFLYILEDKDVFKGAGKEIPLMVIMRSTKDEQTDRKFGLNKACKPLWHDDEVGCGQDGILHYLPSVSTPPPFFDLSTNLNREFLKYFEYVIMSIINGSVSLHYPPSVSVATTLIHVMRDFEPCELMLYRNQLMDGLKLKSVNPVTEMKSWMLYVRRISSESQQQLPFCFHLVSFMAFQNPCYVLGFLILMLWLVDYKGSSYDLGSHTISALENSCLDNFYSSSIVAYTNVVQGAEIEDVTKTTQARHKWGSSNQNQNSFALDSIPLWTSLFQLYAAVMLALGLLRLAQQWDFSYGYDSAELEILVWDPGIYLDLLFHCTTLRTRRFLRGRSCHELRSKIRNTTEGASSIIKYQLLAVSCVIWFSCDVIALYMSLFIIFSISSLSVTGYIR